MKKYISLMLLACFMLTFSSCEQSGNNNSFVFVDPISQYDESDIHYNDNDNISNVSEKNGIAVKQKKYEYKGNNIVILNVENFTDKDYIIKINGVYADKNGNEIGRETKVFEGFAAGYQNYFVFSPNKTFDTFSYTLEIEEFHGIALSKYLDTKGKVKVGTGKTYMDANGNFYDQPHVAISASFQVANTYDKELIYSAEFILFDNKGEIYYIESSLVEGSAVPVENGKNPAEYRIGRYIQYTDTLWKGVDSFVLPEKLQGDIVGIVCVKSIKE